MVIVIMTVAMIMPMMLAMKSTWWLLSHAELAGSEFLERSFVAMTPLN